MGLYRTVWFFSNFPPSNETHQQSCRILSLLETDIRFFRWWDATATWTKRAHPPRVLSLRGRPCFSSAWVKVSVLLSPPSADHEWLQRASDHRQGRLWRGVRLQEGRHGKNVSSVNVLKGTSLGAVTSACVTCVCRSDCQVCHEVFGQEKDQNEAGGDSRTQWENHAVISEHRGELHTMFAPTKVLFFLKYSACF